MRSSQNHNQQTSSAFLPTCPSLLAQYHEEVDHQRSSSFSSILSLNSNFPNDDDDDDQEELPHSWSQLLVGGLSSEEGKFGVSHHFHKKNVENWEEHILLNPSQLKGVPNVDEHIKLENSQSCHLNGSTHGDDRELINHNQDSWPHTQVIMPLSSPRSSVTSLGSNLFNFSGNQGYGRPQILDQSSECNSTSTGGVSKKARVNRPSPSPPQPPLKVRKEKLGERITALHQLVSPFGKTDTASVLLEAIGYIRFLQGQIQALSSPYLCNASTNTRHQHSGNQDGLNKDLTGRGLCLVPVSYMHHVGNDNGADYWKPSPGGGF